MFPPKPVKPWPGRYGRLHRRLHRSRTRLRRVIETIFALRETTNCICLRGNHEQMMMEQRSLSQPGWSLDIPADEAMRWLSNGGADSLISYRDRFGERGRWFEAIPESHWDFFLSTQLEYSHGGFRFVHAGFLPAGQGWDGAEYDLEPRLWIREPFLSSLDDFGGIVVFGHTPQHSGRPLFMSNKIGIDTAAAYGGPLTAIAIDGHHVEVVQV